MFCRVTIQRQTSPNNAMRMLKKRFIENQRMRFDVVETQKRDDSKRRE